MSEERIVGMVYLLIRDHLPYNVVAQMMRQIVDFENAPYTNEHILDAAKELYMKYLDS